MTKQFVCLICNEKAIYRFSPDMDIDGVGSCEKHVVDVELAYSLLLSMDESMFWDFVRTHNDYKGYDKK